MEIPPLALFVRRLSKENRTPITKLWDIHPELMAGVQHRKRLHARRKYFPAEELRELWPCKLLWIKIDQLGS